MDDFNKASPETQAETKEQNDSTFHFAPKIRGRKSQKDSTNQNDSTSQNNSTCHGKQHLENLPTELTRQPRFFLVGADKKPLTKDWSNPENQTLAAQVDGIAGFDTCGHGLNPDYLFLDFDHVLNDAGEFVNDTAERWYNFVQMNFGGYCERSISGHGLHILATPTAGSFKKINAGAQGTLYFDKHATAAERKTSPKLEIFYQSGGRYCLLTGILFGDGDSTKIAEGSDVDGVFQQLLDEIAKQNKPARQKSDSSKSPATPADVSENSPADEAVAILRDIFANVACKDCEYPDWRDLGMVARRYDFPFEEFDDWSAKDKTVDENGKPRYTPEDVRYFWEHYKTADELGDGGITIATAIEISKRHDYTPPRRVFRPKTFEGTADEVVAQIRDACEWHWAKDSHGVLRRTRIKATQANLDLIFGNDPNLRGLVGYNQFQCAIVFLKQAPWHNEDMTGAQWQNADDAQLRVYLRKNYGELDSKQKVEDMLIYSAHANAFHAVKQFLNDLPDWDGEPRAETILIKFLHAKDCEYTRTVTMNFLIGALARIFHPGCDFQTCLVVNGAQRIGKSRLVKMLGGKGGVNPNGENWHVALKDSVDDTHAIDALSRGWIIEIEEFSAARKAEINALKNFISANDDTRRFSYDRYASTRLRHNVFVATCNDKSFLRDQTGNCRFIVVECSQKKFDRVEGMSPEYIRQVWAEALVKYHELFKDSFDESKLQLPLEIQEQAETIAELYTADDGLKTEILGYLDRKIPPLVIWHIFTREQRRKFIADGKITVGQDELETARRARGGRNVEAEIGEIKAFLENRDFVLLDIIKRGEDSAEIRHIIFGNEERQHISAAEIHSECFGLDKRKNMNRINEVLNQLEGWELGERLRDADPQYPDQRKPYYRQPPQKADETD